METYNESEHAIFEGDRKISKLLENGSFEKNIPFETPDDSLVEKIIFQVEYLFSDANILKDKFLRKHVRRNKEGYVSLKLISSLRKVKALSKDWRVVAYSLQKSQKLQMNEEKTKIRRLDPLPMGIDPESSRNLYDYTVLLFCNIPGYWTYENVNRLLSGFKTIKSIAKINSITENMDLDVKRTLNFHGNIATFPFAIAKFDDPSEAADAILRTSCATSLIKVVPLVHGCPRAESMPILYPKLESPNIESIKRNGHNYNEHSKILPLVSRRSEHQTFNLNNSYSSIIKDGKFDMDSKLSQVQKESLNAFEFKEKAYLPSTYRGDGPDNNRWPRKKFFNGYLKGSSVIILRQPKGPDGTRGFQVTRITA